MNSHSKIEPFDIFVAKHQGQNERTLRHYFICIYTQENDNNNNLSNDVYGILVTSNSKYEHFFENNFNDYNVEVRFNGKISYALCDKIVRIPLNDTTQKTEYKLTKGEIFMIKQYLNKFIEEMKRQTNI